MDALTAPWWLAKIVQVSSKIDSILEAAGYDPDELHAPYELWVSHRSAELKDWYQERREEAKKRARTTDPNG